MQIHELTRKQPLTEAGLGDYLKAALSTDPAIVAMHNNPNVSLAQRAQAIGRNKQIDQIAKKAYDSWNQNYLQLVKSNGNQPLSAPEYADELEAFVQKNLMPAYTPLAGVSNAPQIQQAIQTAAASASNPKALAGAFNQIVDLAAVARELPQGRQRARAANQAAQMVTPGVTQTPASPQTPAASGTNYNVPAYQRKQQAQAAAAQPSLALMQKATASLQGGPALTPQELEKVNAYRTSQGQPPIPEPTTDTPAEVTPISPAINPDGSITVAGAQGEKPSKIYPTDPMYPSLAASIAKTAQQSAPDRSPEEIEKYRTNAVNQISGQNKLSTKDAAGRVDALLKKGTFSPRDVQAWARSLPPGNIPSQPYPPGEYPAVNMMVNKLLGLA
jgi:hypothetical protein